MDAFFFVGGYPAGAIAELASQQPVVIVPIDGALAEKITAEYSSLPPTPCPPAPMRGRRRMFPRSRSGRSGSPRPTSPMKLIYGITKALERRHPQATGCRPRQGQGHRGTECAERAGPAAAFGAERFYRSRPAEVTPKRARMKSAPFSLAGTGDGPQQATATLRRARSPDRRPASEDRGAL